MKIEKLFVSLSLITTLGLSQAQAISLENESANYVKTYMQYLDTVSSEKSNIKKFENQINELNKQHRSASKDLTRMQEELSKLKSRQASLPGKISSQESSITRKNSQMQSTLRSEFPSASSVEEVEEQVLNKQARLQRELGNLNDDLESIERPFRSEISFLNQESETLNAENDQFEIDIENTRVRNQTLKVEIEELQQRRRNTRQKMNSGNLEAEITQAELNLQAAEEARIKAGKSCGGLSKFTKRVCKNRNKAKKRLRNLRRIQDGTAIREIRQNIDTAETELEDNRRENKRRRRQLRDNEERLVSIQSEINRAEDDMRVRSVGVREEISRVEFSLRRIQGDVAIAEELVSLQSQVSKHQSNITRYNREIAEAPQKMEALSDGISGTFEIVAGIEIEGNKVQAQLDKINATITAIEENLEKNQAILSQGLEKAAEDIELAEQASIEEKAELISKHDRWNVLEGMSNAVTDRKACKAQTIKNSEEITFSLQVIKLEGPGGYNEPTVMLTVETDSAPLDAYHSLQLRASSSSKTFVMDMIPSLSAQNKRVFFAQMSDRKSMIDTIILKSKMRGTFTDANDKNTASFSLSGSTNAIKRRSNSLSKTCGGIEIL